LLLLLSFHLHTVNRKVKSILEQRLFFSFPSVYRRNEWLNFLIITPWLWLVINTHQHVVIFSLLLRQKKKRFSCFFSSMLFVTPDRYQDCLQATRLLIHFLLSMY
jgi:hypothetical protein